MNPAISRILLWRAWVWLVMELFIQAIFSQVFMQNEKKKFCLKKSRGQVVKIRKRLYAKDTYWNPNYYIFSFLQISSLYSSRKYPYSPHRRDWNFLVERGGGVWGFCKAKNLKKCMKLDWGGGGGLRENPFCAGGMDIFWNYTFLKCGDLKNYFYLSNSNSVIPGLIRFITWNYKNEIWEQIKLSGIKGVFASGLPVIYLFLSSMQLQNHRKNSKLKVSSRLGKNITSLWASLLTLFAKRITSSSWGVLKTRLQPEGKYDKSYSEHARINKPIGFHSTTYTVLSWKAKTFNEKLRSLLSWERNWVWHIILDSLELTQGVGEAMK